MHHLAKFTKFNWLITLIDLQYITATATSLGLMSCNPHKQQGQWCSRSSRENSEATFAQVFSKWRLLQRSPQLWKHCKRRPSTENTKLIATNIFGSNCFIVCLELVLYTIYSSFLVHYVNSSILVMFFTKFIKLYSHRITISLCESFHWLLSASSISRRVVVMGTMTAERSLKSRFNEHQRQSSTISEVLNTFTLSILWNWRTQKSWRLNPDGLKEEWRKLSL